MANQNYQTHTFCLFATVVIHGLSPSIANQTPATPLEPFLIWIIYQFIWLSLIDLTDSYRIHWRPFFVMSIPWNRDVLLGRRFVSGAFAHYRWNFRLSTGESPLTQWYRDVTWVFDPGINEVIILLEGTRIIYPIGYVSRIELGLSFILGILVTCARYGTWYSCVECDNGFLVPLKLSDDGDGFPLPWLEFFVSWIHCMGCGLYGSKIKVMTFFHDDDGDYFPWSEAFRLSERVHHYIQLTCLWYNPNQVTSLMRRKMVKSDCDGDVFSFPWSENHMSMKWKIMGDRASFNALHGLRKRCYNILLAQSPKGTKMRWYLLMVRQVLRGLSESFIRGDLYHNIGFTTLEVCLQNGHMRILALWLGIYEYKETKETLVANEQSCIRRFKCHGLEPLQTTYNNFLLITVMRKAFRSFIYKMIAFSKYMKRGLNRFYLLPVRLLLESRVTSTSSSKLGFNFLYLFQWLYLNGFMYHVSCKTFMK